MYPIKKLSEICVIWPKKSELKLQDDLSISFVPMRDLKERKKYFLPQESKKINEVYSWYTYFRESDVILAKVTPCFENGKSWIARNLENWIWFWSSEFYVFRCQDEIIPEFLYLIISSDSFLTEWAQNMSWAVGLQRVKKAFIEDYPIPLPPLPIQKAIVAKLDEAFTRIDRSIELVRGNVAELEEINKSITSTLFYSGDFQIKTLEDVCEKITDWTHQTPTYFSEWFIFLSSKNVTRWIIDWDNIKYIDKKQHLEMYKRVAPKKNDILLAKNWTTWVAALVDKDEIFNIYVSLALIRPKEIILPKFLLYFINSPEAKNQFNSRLKWVGVPNLHLKEIKQVNIPLPSLPTQQSIVSHLDQVFNKNQALRLKYEEQIAELQSLKQSLLKDAFEWKLITE